MSKIYITWNEDDNHTNIVPHIVSVSKDLPLNAKNVEIVQNNELVEEFSTINPGDEIKVSCFESKLNCNEIYILIQHESGGGGSYHALRKIFVADCINKLTEIAMETFDLEHNRNDGDCEDCQDVCGDSCIEKCPCRLQVLEEFKPGSMASFRCSDFDGCDLQLFKITCK